MAEWQSFYMIVGSAGAALISVQFVVLTLIAGLRQRPTAETLHAFATPSVVHLAGVIVIAAVMSAPWHATAPIAVALAAYGVGGVAYGLVVVRRARRQTMYEPVWQDWAWYALLPCSAYAALAVAAAFLATDPRHASFAIGAAALGLLLVSVHNAWDSVTHVLVYMRPGDDARPPEDEHVQDER